MESKRPISGTPPRSADLHAVRSLATGTVVASYSIQFVVAAAAYYVMWHYRFFDPDEGHFLSAIRSAYDGLAACRDFFYQQMPLFPYPYAAAMRLFGCGYESCLWVSILCGAGLSVVTAAYFTHQTGRLAAGWIGWSLIVLNAQVLHWTPTVKNHAMPLFFGALALYAASRRTDSARGAFGWGVVAGLAAMSSVGMRLLALPFIIAAAAWILCRAVLRSSPTGASWGVVGFIVGVMPPALLCLRSVLPDPWVFYFNNVGFHEMRSGPEGTYGTSVTVTNELRAMLCQGQFPAILLAAVITAIWQLVRKPDLRVPLASKWLSSSLCLFGIFAAVLALLPYETFHQYFMVPLLFLIVATVPLWQRMLAAPRSLRSTTAIVVLIAAYGLTPSSGSVALLNHGEWVFPQCPKEWSHEDMFALSNVLARVTGPDDLILSTWQGYTFLANRRDVPGNENFNARVVATLMPPDQLHRLHVASDDELAAMIDRGDPKAIVVGCCWNYYVNSIFENDPKTGQPHFRSGILRHYRLVAKRDGVQYVFVRQ